MDPDPVFVYTKIEPSIIPKIILLEYMKLNGLDSNLWLNKPTDEEIEKFRVFK